MFHMLLVNILCVYCNTPPYNQWFLNPPVDPRTVSAGIADCEFLGYENMLKTVYTI